MSDQRITSQAWPALPFDAWRDTAATLQLWTQVIGKVRLARTPWLNHSWHVTLYLTARGLTTSLIPHGSRFFEITFDFVDHRLRITTDDGAEWQMPLVPQSVAQFYRAVMDALASLNVPVEIDEKPNEVVDAIPFSADHQHASYDREYAQRFWRVLLQTDRVFTEFRTRFLGKSSPVHFFWGSFDLAVTRFSGRPAPRHPGGVPNLPDEVAQEAYSHEVSSAGFWPGGGLVDYAAYYSYAYPEPPGYRDAKVRPSAAVYHEQLKEFVLPYDAVRTATSPEAVLMDFLQSTYEAAADQAGWDRAALECSAGRLGIPRAT